MALGDVLSEFVQAYGEFATSLPPLFQQFITLFALVILIVIYTVFIWKLHRFVGTKNIFKFNLNKYNDSKNPGLTKLLASGFYLLEYILIIPFIIFFWFVVFTFFLVLLVEESMAVSTILLISAIAIASIRMTSYIPGYGQKLAQDIAKILPFTFLGIAVLNPGIFTELIQRMSTRLEDIGLLLQGALPYFLFIVLLEVLLRLFEFIFSISGIIHDSDEEQEEQ